MAEIIATARRGGRPAPIRGHHAGVGAVIGTVASLGAAAAGSCCALPLALASAGIGGAWLGGLADIAPYRMYILSVAVIGLGVGWTAYIRGMRRSACDGRAPCGTRTSRWWTVGSLAISTILVVYAAMSTWLEPIAVRALLAWNSGP